MFRRKPVITWFVGMASTALPAFSKSGTPADSLQLETKRLFGIHSKLPDCSKPSELRALE